MNRQARSKPLTQMNQAELAKATAEFEKEFVADTFGAPGTASLARHSRAKQKRGRPRRGLGAKVISVTVEQGLLRRADKLAKKLKLSRAKLIERGLRDVLARAS